MSDDLIPTPAYIAWGFIGAAYAAACVWTGIRLVNRRERRAKFTAVALAVAPLLYILSSGPVAMIVFQSRVTTAQTTLPNGAPVAAATSEISFGKWFPIAYAPLFWASERAESDAIFTYWLLFPHERTWVDS